MTEQVTKSSGSDSQKKEKITTHTIVVKMKGYKKTEKRIKKMKKRNETTQQNRRTAC